MGKPRSFDARDQVPNADSTDNIQFQDVIGNKSDAASTASTASLVALTRSVLSAVGTAGQIDWQQSQSSNIDEDGGRYTFDVGVMDRDTGAVASGSINIASAVVTFEKSTGGGAFSTAGITQPTAAKAAGLVTVSADLVASEWQVGDHYKLTLTTISATNSSSGTEYMPAMVWFGQIVEDVDIKTTIDDIDTDVGEPGDANTEATLHGRQKVPNANSTDNVLLRDVVGSKSDTAKAVTDTGNTTDSLMRLMVSLFNRTATASSSNNNTAAASATLAETIGRKDDTSLAVTSSAGTSLPLMTRLNSAVNRLSTPSAADNTTAAASSTISELLGRKDDAATTTVGVVQTITGWLKGVVSRTAKLDTSALTNSETANTVYFKVANAWEVEATTAISDATVGSGAQENLLDKGADTGTPRYKMESALCNVVSMGSNTNIKFRLWAEINGTLTQIGADVDRTGTGAFDLLSVLGVMGSIASRHVRVTVLGNNAANDGSVAATFITSKAGV